MDGYTGKIGIVDLTHNITSFIETDESLIKDGSAGKIKVDNGNITQLTHELSKTNTNI